MLATREHTHFVKTAKGAKEISERRHNLRGKMRTMLILVDATKSIDQLMDQAHKLGVPPDFLDVMVREGYVAPVGDLRAIAAAPPLPALADDEPPVLSDALPSVARVRDPSSVATAEMALVAEIIAAGGEPSAAANAEEAPTPMPVSDDEPARFRAAKSYMNETASHALGLRGFMFTRKLERCASRSELAALMPEYQKAMEKRGSAADAAAVVERMRELLA